MAPEETYALGAICRTWDISYSRTSLYWILWGVIKPKCLVGSVLLPIFNKGALFWGKISAAYYMSKMERGLAQILIFVTQV